MLTASPKDKDQRVKKPQKTLHVSGLDHKDGVFHVYPKRHLSQVLPRSWRPRDPAWQSPDVGEADEVTVPNAGERPPVGAVTLEMTHAESQLTTTRTGRGGLGLEETHERTFDFKLRGNNLHGDARRLGDFSRC